MLWCFWFNLLCVKWPCKKGVLTQWMKVYANFNFSDRRWSNLCDVINECSLTSNSNFVRMVLSPFLVLLSVKYWRKLKLWKRRLLPPEVSWLGSDLKSSKQRETINLIKKVIILLLWAHFESWRHQRRSLWLMADTYSSRSVQWKYWQ